MDTLPKGITGFWSYYKTSFFARLFMVKGKPIPEVDTHHIENIILQLEALFKTVGHTPPQINSNFHLVSLFSGTDSYQIGIHSVYPYYCGIKSIPDWETIHFCDLPDQITSILNNNFTELSKTYLQQEVTPQHLHLLDPVEIQQITYWETKKVGNVIFNKYD